MFLRKVHSVLAIFLMVLLLGAKFAAYHTLSHDNECIECCSFCDEAMTLGQTPALAQELSWDELLIIPDPGEIEQNLIFRDLTETKRNPSPLFSRPPPIV